MYKIAKENYKKYSELLHKYKSWLLIRTGKRKITKKKIKNNMDIVLYKATSIKAKDMKLIIFYIPLESAGVGKALIVQQLKQTKLVNS